MRQIRPVIAHPPCTLCEEHFHRGTIRKATRSIFSCRKGVVEWCTTIMAHGRHIVFPTVLKYMSLAQSGDENCWLPAHGTSAFTCPYRNLTAFSVGFLLSRSPQSWIQMSFGGLATTRLIIKRPLWLCPLFDLCPLIFSTSFLVSKSPPTQGGISFTKLLFLPPKSRSRLRESEWLNEKFRNMWYNGHLSP